MKNASWHELTSKQKKSAKKAWLKWRKAKPYKTETELWLAWFKQEPTRPPYFDDYQPGKRKKRKQVKSNATQPWEYSHKKRSR